MSAVATFLKGKVEESLTKLVQPAGLVPAALLVLLNLAFILPVLRAEESAPVAAFDDLSASWQGVVFALVVFFAGYLLLTLASNVLDTLSGESWRHSWAYAVLKQRTQDRLSRRTAARGYKAGRLEGLSDRFEFRSAYPLSRDPTSLAEDERTMEYDYLAPTAMGNAIRASYRRLAERHGIDAVALASTLTAAMDKDSVAATQMTDARAALDTLVNTAFVLALFALEGIVIYSSQQNWSAVMLSALAVPAAYACYRAAIPKARDWGGALEVACALQRKKLREALSLREPTSAEDELALWKDTSKFLLWGEPDAEKILAPYKGKSAAAATITASPGMEVTPRTDELVEVVTTRGKSELLALSFVVSNTKTSDLDAFLAVSDERVPVVHSAPPVTVIPDPVTPADVRVDPSTARPDVVVTVVPRLAGRSSAWVRLELPVWRADVDDLAVLTSAKSEQDGAGLVLALASPDGTATTATVTIAALSAVNRAVPGLTVDGGGVATGAPVPDGAGGHQWQLANLKLPSIVRIVFEEV